MMKAYTTAEMAKLDRRATEGFGVVTKNEERITSAL
jgi:hypothetical protein